MAWLNKYHRKEMSPTPLEPLIKEQGMHQAALDNVCKAISTVFKAPLVTITFRKPRPNSFSQ